MARTVVLHKVKNDIEGRNFSTVERSSVSVLMASIVDAIKVQEDKELMKREVEIHHHLELLALRKVVVGV